MLRAGSRLSREFQTSLHRPSGIVVRACTSSSNQEEPKWRQRRNQKKSFYQRKGFWFFTATATAATGFAIYELNPNGTFGPKTVSDQGDQSTPTFRKSNKISLFELLVEHSSKIAIAMDVTFMGKIHEYSISCVCEHAIIKGLFLGVRLQLG